MSQIIKSLGAVTAIRVLSHFSRFLTHFISLHSLVHFQLVLRASMLIKSFLLSNSTSLFKVLIMYNSTPWHAHKLIFTPLKTTSSNHRIHSCFVSLMLSPNNHLLDKKNRTCSFSLLCSCAGFSSLHRNVISYRTKMIYCIYTTSQTFWTGSLHLFDPKYSKSSNIVKYF